MLSFFQSNNPSVVLFYLFYLVLFRICFYIIPIDTNFVFEHREPLSRLLFGFLKNISPNFIVISVVLSGVLCFIQSLIINGIVNSNKFLSRKNYTAGLFFLIFSSFFKESLALSPASIALTFLIPCAGRIFSLFKNEKPNTAIFDVGFLIAIATLFYFPSILFIIPAYFGLATIRAFSYREWVIVLVGFLCPFIIAFTYYFWNDRAHLLLSDIANIHSNIWLKSISFSRMDGAIFFCVSFLSLGLLAMLPSALYSSLIQVRKFSSVLVFFLLFTAISFALQQTINLSHLVLLSLPLGIISSLVLMQLKNKLVSEVIHIILILLVLTGQFLPLFNFF